MGQDEARVRCNVWTPSGFVPEEGVRDICRIDCD